MNKIWITWEDQRRNREVSKALGAKLFEFSEIDLMSNPLRKYPVGVWKTLKVFFKEKPKLVYAQNPSIVLSLLVIIMKHIFHIRVVIDAHNVGLFPAEGKSRILNQISRYIQRKADVTIVTNEALKKYVEENDGRAFVLPDKIPDFLKVLDIPLKGKKNILFICTFAEDEPYLEVFKAAEILEDNVFIYVTGNFAKTNLNESGLPNNVVLTGFLPENDYVQMLFAVDAIIDLTTRENCLVCGAYESIAAEKPMILSNTTALRNYFHSGVVFTENHSKSLTRSISKVLSNKNELIHQIKILKDEKIGSWEVSKKELLQIQKKLLKNRDFQLWQK